VSERPVHDEGVARQKARDAGIVLPLAGLVLLTPPVATAAAVDGRLLGVPVAVIYVFGVWAALILGARLLARRLVVDQPAPPRATGDARPR